MAGQVINNQIGQDNTAWQYCTGPVDVFVGTASTTASAATPTPPKTPGGSQGADEEDEPIAPPANAYKGISLVGGASYIGTCEQYPVVRGADNWNPLFSDDTGDMEPFDYMRAGSWKIIILDFNKFIQSNMPQVSKGPSLSRVGQLLQGQGWYLRLWLRFHNFGQPIAPHDMPAGEAYPCCRIIDQIYSRTGTRDRVTGLVLRTCPALFLTGKYQTVYSTDEADLKLPDAS